MKHEPIRRQIKNATDKRVSEDTVNLMQKHLTEILEELSTESASLAEHAGRKTLRKEDLEKAIQDKEQ